MTAVHFRTEGLSHDDVYRFLTSVVVPRPIAWVSTLDPGSGLVNLAPFSFFTVCSIDPPMLCFTVGSADDGSPKDTARNVLAAREFVVNVVTEALAGSMNATAAPYPPHVSELAEVGLTAAPSIAVRPPRVAESPVSMECRLDRVVLLGRAPSLHHLVIGEVVACHVRDGLLDDGYRVDVRGLRPLGRLAGSYYCRTGDWVRHDRPTLETPPAEPAGPDGGAG